MGKLGKPGTSRRVAELLAAVALGAASIACSGGDGGDGDADPEPQAERTCDRAELRSLVDDYVAALGAHDPSSVPIAPDVRATENGEPTEPGEGLWRTAGRSRFTRSAFDPERCGTHTQAVLDHDGEPAIAAVRLRVDPAEGEVTEIETYVTHEGDYFLFDADGVARADRQRPDLPWDRPVPDAQRATREELNELADAYFDSFEPEGIVAPIDRGCDRWENGVRTTAGDCRIGLPEPGEGRAGLVTHRRYPIADVEAGIAIGYVRFYNALDVHMFKVVDGRIRLIQAVVIAAGPDRTGWEDQEQGQEHGQD